MKSFITNLLIVLLIVNIYCCVSYAIPSKELPTLEQKREINAIGGGVEALIANKQYAKACALSYEMFCRYPKEPDAYFVYAKASYHAGYPDRAIKYYEKCIKIDNTYYQAYCNLGFVYYKRKEYKKAIRYYNKAMRIIAKSMEKERNRQEYALMLSNRALAKYNSGKVKSALKDYNNISIKDIPDYYGADHVYFSRGLCKYDLGDEAGALEDYNKAKELNPTFEYIYYNQKG